MRLASHLFLALLTATAAAQAQDAKQAPRSGDGVARTVVPNPEYQAGRLHRVFFGSHYRELWATPITVPVLDLNTFAGGLIATDRTGSRQTIGVRLKGKNGKEYNFRSVDKEPANALPPELRKSLVERVFQDQMSAQYPAAAVIVAPLLEAAGVLHVTPRLFVLPDDPRLGQYRQEFAGLLGMLEERKPSFPGASKVADTQELFAALEVDPRQRVDVPDYLRARLMDILIGDWDRHSDQWDWVALPRGKGTVWRPLPKDRDWAFSRMDGVVPTLVRQAFPQTVGFDQDYPPMLNLTWTAKELDRRLLPALERSVWKSVAADLQRRLTNAVIERAVNQQPGPFQQKGGERLIAALRNRRDKLGEAAEEFYQLLADQADVHSTDASEQARIEHQPRAVLLSIRSSGPGGRELFRRRFLADETREVRVYLHGGTDTAVVKGSRSGIRVMVVGAEVQQGDQGPDTRFFEERKTDAYRQARSDDKDVKQGKGADSAAVDPGEDEGTAGAPPPPAGKDPSAKGADAGAGRKKSEPATAKGDPPGGGKGDQKADRKDEPDSADAAPAPAPEERDPEMPSEEFAPPPRASHFLVSQPEDWGHKWTWQPWVEYRSDYGILLGARFSRYGYGFRSLPHASLFQATSGYAFGADGLRLDVVAEDPQIAEPWGARVHLRLSQVESNRFFGFGNESPPAPDRNQIRVLQDMVRIRTAVLRTVGPLTAEAGPAFQFTRTHRDPLVRADSLSPLGMGEMVLVGVDGLLRWEGGAPPGFGLGAQITLEGHLAQAVGENPSRFFRGGARGAAYVTPNIPFRPIWLVRAGVQRVWGRYPFQEAAYIGGRGTLRGFSRQRFGGDAAVNLGSELRIQFTNLHLFGMELGLLGLVDAGRVFLKGESSHKWHTGYGGGIWGGALEKRLIVNLVLARSVEKNALYIYTGFAF